jgi:predicted nucleotidyltransferase
LGGEKGIAVRNLVRLSTKKYFPAEIEALYRPLLPLILQATNPLKVVLFGSATGERFDDWSDLDFVVVFDDSADLFENRRALYRLRAHSERNLEFICVSSSHYERMRKLGGVIRIADQEGKVLYERTFPL